MNKFDLLHYKIIANKNQKNIFYLLFIIFYLLCPTCLGKGGGCYI